jgi:HSP20 family protein
MRITRWDPFRELDEVRKEMNRLLRRFPVFEPVAEGEWESSTFFPAVDLKEEDDHLSLVMDLPGVKKDDIEIRVDGNLLQIRAERKFEDEKSQDKYYRLERFYGVFQRSFTLPDKVDPEKLKAKYENGVLTITLPKKAESHPKKVKVE